MARISVLYERIKKIIIIMIVWYQLQRQRIIWPFFEIRSTKKQPACVNLLNSKIQTGKNSLFCPSNDRIKIITAPHTHTHTYTCIFPDRVLLFFLKQTNRKWLARVDVADANQLLIELRVFFSLLSGLYFITIRLIKTLITPCQP